MTYDLTQLNNVKGHSFSGRWVKILISSVLFLGILPFDKAALTLYSSESLGIVLSYVLCGVTLLLTIFLFVFNHNLKVDQTNKNLFVVGFLIIFGYVLSSIRNGFSLERILSIACFLIYYLFSFFFFDDIDDLILSIGISLAALIFFSFILYLQNNYHVMYVASAYETNFKGIASNRNSFAELALFDIVIFSYLLSKKKLFLFSILSIFLAIYGTFLTKGATSIICCILLIIMLFFNKTLKKTVSYKFFVVFLFFSFIIIFLLKNIDALKPLYVFFNKSSSLTGRTDRWDYTASIVFNKPLFGYGYDFTILLENGFVENDPHNGILYILLSQGFFGLVIFFYTLYMFMKKVVCFKRDILVRFLYIFMIVWSIRALVESGYSYTHFIFWICPLIFYKKGCIMRYYSEQRIEDNVH